VSNDHAIPLLSKNIDKIQDIKKRHNPTHKKPSLHFQEHISPLSLPGRENITYEKRVRPFPGKTRLPGGFPVCRAVFFTMVSVLRQLQTAEWGRRKAQLNCLLTRGRYSSHNGTTHPFVKRMRSINCPPINRQTQKAFGEVCE
jgi:hypothetical protein